VLSGRGFCNELITRPGESYRLWCVVCDLETSRMRRPSPTGGCRAQNKLTVIFYEKYKLWIFTSISSLPSPVNSSPVAHICTIQCQHFVLPHGTAQVGFICCNLRSLNVAHVAHYDKMLTAVCIDTAQHVQYIECTQTFKSALRFT
jgi:hypothetical protein